MFRLRGKGKIKLTQGTTYVVSNFGTFVCSRCAGLLRDLNFKVKGIGVCNFTNDELNFLTRMGNDVRFSLLRMQNQFGWLNSIKMRNCLIRKTQKQ